MTKRLLVVSCNLPYPPETQTHGVFQRLDMFQKAGSTLVTQIDMLFFVPPKVPREAGLQHGQTALTAKGFGYRDGYEIWLVARVETLATACVRDEGLHGEIGEAADERFLPLCDGRRVIDKVRRWPAESLGATA